MVGALGTPKRGKNQPIKEPSSMKTYLKAYGAFLVFTVITALVVKPMTKNIPLIGDALNK